MENYNGEGFLNVMPPPTYRCHINDFPMLHNSIDHFIIIQQNTKKEQITINLMTPTRLLVMRYIVLSEVKDVG